MACVICGRESVERIPVIGHVCSECSAVLSVEFVLDGVIHSPSIRVLAESMDREFQSRAERLKRMAFQLAGGGQ